MSFRTRLTSFFVVIVVLPMIGVGFLVFRLISQSENGKADARAAGLASTAASVYQSRSADAKADAAAIARAVSNAPSSALAARASALGAQAGLARVTVSVGPRSVLDRGDRTAVAPGTATIHSRSGGTVVITASEVTAAQYAREATAAGDATIVRQGPRTLTSTAGRPAPRSLPNHGTVSIGGSDYRAAMQSFRGFGPAPVDVTVLSNLNATSGSVGTSRALAAGFIVAFLLLALAFSVLASRALQGQLARFLEAARRIGQGDFSSRVPTEGNDEFAALGTEFNQMADELSNRVDELADERARTRESIRRIGQTFASGLDRPALLELALHTAVDAVEAGSGRLSARSTADDPLSESARVGSLSGVEDQVLEAERAALCDGGVGEVHGGDVSVASVALGAFEDTDRSHGLITVTRRGTRFTVDERELLRSLASEATLALENVELHEQIQRQATTDPLTGLTNHGHFHEQLSLELEEARRYSYPVGLIMLDIDNFKSFNDTYGHQQGDIVLRNVARVLRDNSREVDVPARYGGEELALILPHTDLEGSYAIAERVRMAIEGLQVPRTDRVGDLSVTASTGVSVFTGGDKDALIGEADAALYEAKRRGKNRTVRAASRSPNVIGAE